MTDRRALKQLVRQRMSRTGETYTTAHRHVTARAGGAAQPGITPGYPGFGAEQHRPSALARHLLDQAGLRISEPLACGLGGGIGFLYAVFEYASVPHPMLTVVAQHHPQPWLESVAQHLGINLRTVHSSRPGPALAKLDATLDGGRAAQLTVARGLLPWHPDVPELESAEPYDVVLAGRDGADYLVDDADPEPHRIDAERLGAAWAGHRKGRFALTTVEPVSGTPDLAAAVRAAIRTTHAHLTGPVLGNSFDANLGLSGMQRLAADLADTRTKRGWVRRFETPQTFAVVAGRLAECLTWAYTAPGATRPLYATFLAEASEVAGLDLGDAAAAATDSGRLWTRMADVAGAPDAAADPASTIATLGEVAAEVVEVETRLADLLGRASGD